MTTTSAFVRAARATALALTCWTGLAVNAQSDPAADELLSRVSEAMQGHETVHAVYTSKMIDRQSDFEMDQAGEIWVQGDRYHLELGEYTIICDGSTVWTYEPEMGECYIDDAETIAEDGIDPAKMFTIWEEGFKKAMKGDAMVGDRAVTRVDLHPDGAQESSFHTIQCFVDEDNLEVVQLIVKGREGTDVVYRIEKFEGNGLVPDGAFRFDQTAYPGITVIDNRL